LKSLAFAKAISAFFSFVMGLSVICFSVANGEMSRTPLGAGDAIYCSSRDNGGGAAEGGAVLLIVRAACGVNQSMRISPFAPPRFLPFAPPRFLPSGECNG
jgi:hypothetical protein